MANLLVVCRNDGTAGRLCHRTADYLKHHNMLEKVNYIERHIIDSSDNTDIRFITLREIDQGIDDDFVAMRMDDDVYEHWLDQVEINMLRMSRGLTNTSVNYIDISKGRNNSMYVSPEVYEHIMNNPDSIIIEAICKPPLELKVIGGPRYYMEKLEAARNERKDS